jgi:AcrR family transcriptional regulator
MKVSDKRDNIMRAALELVTEKGFHGAPMSRIAEEAGVAAGTIYCYFESKDTLIDELYHELEEKLLAVLKEGYSTTMSLRERFLHLGTALLKYFITNPACFRYMEQYMLSPFGTALKKNRLLGQTGEESIFKNLFEDGIFLKVLKDLPLFIHFALAFGPLIALARDQTLGLISMDDAQITQATEACWDGIKR